MRVTGPSDEFLFGVRSLRTRGMFTYTELPGTGSGTFALRTILCDETQRPLTLVLERNHRYFYLVFSLREVSTYRALTLFAGNPRSCLHWSEEHGRFSPVACPDAAGSKC